MISSEDHLSSVLVAQHGTRHVISGNLEEKRCHIGIKSIGKVTLLCFSLSHLKKTKKNKKDLHVDGVALPMYRQSLLYMV